MDLKDFAEIVNKLAVGLAALIGSIWAIYTFRLARTHVWNLQLDVEHDVVSHEDARCLVVVRVSLKNVGKVKIEPGKTGCLVSAKRIPRNQSSGSIVTWESLGNELFLDNVDILARSPLCQHTCRLKNLLLGDRNGNIYSSI